jgi:plastocyanin
MKRSRITRWVLSSVALSLGAWFWEAPSLALGAGTNVSIVDFAFNPPSVTINANDSVIWIWQGPTSVHTTTSDTNSATMWDSGLMSAAVPGFTNVFKSSGTFPYHCNVHPTLMMGTVTVQGPGPVQPKLTSIQRPSPASFQFSYSTTAGVAYVVQRSANLVNWNTLATNNASGSQATFTDNAANAAASFYRVKILPAP